MRCIKCLNNLKKCRLIFGLCSVLLSFSFCLFGLLSQSVNALETTTTTYVSSVGDFTFQGYTGNNYERVSVKPYVFRTQSSATGLSRLTHPQITISDPGSSGVFWTMYMDIYVGTLADGQPVITCPNSAIGAKFVVDSCDVISGGTFTYDQYQAIQPSQSYNSLIRTEDVFTHYILTLNGHVANDSPGYLLNLRGDFLQVTRGYYELSISVSNVRFFSSQSQESQAINNQTQQQQDYHDETQQTFDDAQDTADTDSDSSSTQASASGTTLLAGFTSFLGALTNATPSNCVIDGNIGDFRMGNIDLCQLDPPPAFQAISSIMVIGFTVPLSIALGRKMISLFRSFQG